MSDQVDPGLVEDDGPPDVDNDDMPVEPDLPDSAYYANADDLDPADVPGHEED